MTRTLLLAVVLGLHSPPACAQMPDEAALEREMQAIEAHRREMFAVEPHSGGFPKQLPAFDKPAMDLDAVVQQFQAQQASVPQEELMVFASLGMPETALDALITEAGRVGAVVVLRGFKANSLRQTAQVVAKYAQASTKIVVNPHAFVRYEVSVVPAVVIAQGEAEQADGCAPAGAYVKVTGDVSLSYALRRIAAQSPDFKAISTRYLGMLEGSL